MDNYFIRILCRMYWFYHRVLRENDPFYLFFYTILAFTGPIVFYIVGATDLIMNVIEPNYIVGGQEYLGILGIVSGISFPYFYKNKEKYLKIFNNYSDEKFCICDIGVIIYFVFSLVFMLFALFYTQKPWVYPTY